MEASQHAALFQQDIEPLDLHGDNSNIWGPKIDRMRIRRGINTYNVRDSSFSDNESNKGNFGITLFVTFTQPSQIRDSFR